MNALDLAGPEARFWWRWSRNETRAIGQLVRRLSSCRSPLWDDLLPVVTLETVRRLADCTA